MVKPSSSSASSAARIGGLDDPADRRTLPRMTATAKVTNRGRAQTISLPKAFRFPGKTVQLQRMANGVLITVPDDLEARRRRFMKLAGSCPDFPLREPHTTPDIPRDFS